MKELRRLKSATAVWEHLALGERRLLLICDGVFSPRGRAIVDGVFVELMLGFFALLGVIDVADDGVLQHKTVSQGDPAIQDYSIGLRMFLNDADAIEIVRIGVKRKHVELFVVHEDAPEEGRNVEVGGEVGPNEEAGAEADVANGQNEEGFVESDVPNDENGGGAVEEAAPVVQNGEEAVDEEADLNVENEAVVAEDARSNEEGEPISGEAESNEEAAHNDHAKDVVGEGDESMDYGNNVDAGGEEQPSVGEGYNAGCNDREDDSADAEYVLSAEEVDSAEDAHFTAVKKTWIWVIISSGSK
ncbi:hypothetical protein PIB30_070995 [Stylosanthes scabra]|uniref:Uncharacterized protein n=1 Tax=Stylosanthes scabra TaxID=79078 RepID=A0ABU6YMI8_9FABA|nr:hypothetical protein [Stylosanthes scabra]